MSNHRALVLIAVCPLALLSACGGGGSGGIASAPTPAPFPSSSPTPAPSPTAVLRPDLIAIEPDQSYATFGLSESDTMSSSYDRTLSGSKDNAHITQSRPGQKQEQMSFLYDNATDSYSITFPDGTSGQLALKYLNGSAGQIATSTGHAVNGPSGDLGVLVTMPVPFSPGWRYTYSHYGEWSKTKPNLDGSAVQTWGLFVYGYETPASAIPRTGTANYTGEIMATSPVDPWNVGGSVRLSFNYGAGVLTGNIHPVFNTNGFYPNLDHDYGQYDFAQTVYAVGDSRYSGIFSRNGTVLSDSWFEGSLAGPAAEEAIGRFVAPYSRDGSNGALTGVWIAKRD